MFRDHLADRFIVTCSPVLEISSSRTEYSRGCWYMVYIYMFSLVGWFRDTEEEWDF